MKLSKLLDIFKQKDLIDESTLARDFAILRQYTPMLFPTKFENDSRIASIELNDLKIGGNTSDAFMPYHTRDNDWLAHYLHDFVKFMQKMEKREAQLTGKPIDTKDLASLEEYNQPKIRYRHVKKFVETDELFNKHRNDYEEDLVRAQIDFMMHDNQPNGLLMRTAYNPINNQFMVIRDFDPDMIRKALNADKVFRDDVVNAMRNLGIDQHSIEAGIEKHGVWRDKMMTYAYYNHYPLPSQDSNLADNEGLDEVVNVMREGFKDTWLRQRKGQYYENHQDILQELAMNEMKLKDNEAKELDERVTWWNNHYYSTMKFKQNQTVQNHTAPKEDILEK